MGEQKNRKFSGEFKSAAVGRVQAGESPSALARELGVKRKLLYEWKKRVEAGGAQNLRESGRPGPVPGAVLEERTKSDQRRIAELERLVGKQQVREGIQSRFDGIPDVHYGDDSHWLCGDRGVSEWTLRGTQRTGESIEVRGCDLFQFVDGKISG